jgi:hypothetical protein
MRKRLLFVPVLFVFLAVRAPCKLFDRDEENRTGRRGHAGDITRLFFGENQLYNALPEKALELINILVFTLALTVDYTRAADENTVLPAINFLKNSQKTINLDNIPNASEFISPGGSSHGYHTHLGWDHVYDETSSVRWLKRREVLRDVTGKLFGFSPLDNLFDERADRKSGASETKRNSLAALLYYVHILGDHETDKPGNGNTRAPISTFEEQVNKPGWPGWNMPPWKPEKTIKEELRIHLKVLFGDGRRNQRYRDNYRQMMERIDAAGGDPQDAAKRILQILSFYCPLLLREEKFAEGFYRKSGL